MPTNASSRTCQAGERANCQTPLMVEVGDGAEGLRFGQRVRVGVRGHQPSGLTVEIVGHEAIGASIDYQDVAGLDRGSPRPTTMDVQPDEVCGRVHWTGANPQVINQTCARICARDSAGWVEMEETHHARPEHPPPVCRGQRGSQRLTGTPETGVVVLITQR